MKNVYQKTVDNFKEVLDFSEYVDSYGDHETSDKINILCEKIYKKVLSGKTLKKLASGDSVLPSGQEIPMWDHRSEILEDPYIQGGGKLTGPRPTSPYFSLRGGLKGAVGNAVSGGINFLHPDKYGFGRGAWDIGLMDLIKEWTMRDAVSDLLKKTKGLTPELEVMMPDAAKNPRDHSSYYAIEPDSDEWSIEKGKKKSPKQLKEPTPALATPSLSTSKVESQPWLAGLLQGYGYAYPTAQGKSRGLGPDAVGSLGMPGSGIPKVVYDDNGKPHVVVDKNGNIKYWDDPIQLGQFLGTDRDRYNQSPIPGTGTKLPGDTQTGVGGSNFGGNKVINPK